MQYYDNLAHHCRRQDYCASTGIRNFGQSDRSSGVPTMASGLRELVASGLYRHRGVSVAVTKSSLSLSSLLLPSPHPTVIAFGTHTFSLLTEVAFSGFYLTMPLQPLALHANGYFFWGRSTSQTFSVLRFQSFSLFWPLLCNCFHMLSQWGRACTRPGDMFEPTQ